MKAQQLFLKQFKSDKNPLIFKWMEDMEQYEYLVSFHVFDVRYLDVV